MKVLAKVNEIEINLESLSSFWCRSIYVLITIELFSLSLSSIFSIYNWHDLFPKICGIENLRYRDARLWSNNSKDPLNLNDEESWKHKCDSLAIKTYFQFFRRADQFRYFQYYHIVEVYRFDTLFEFSNKNSLKISSKSTRTFTYFQFFRRAD